MSNFVFWEWGHGLTFLSEECHVWSKVFISFAGTVKKVLHLNTICLLHAPSPPTALGFLTQMYLFRKNGGVCFSQLRISAILLFSYIKPFLNTLIIKIISYTVHEIYIFDMYIYLLKPQQFMVNMRPELTFSKTSHCSFSLPKISHFSLMYLG